MGDVRPGWVSWSRGNYARVHGAVIRFSNGLKLEAKQVVKGTKCLKPVSNVANVYVVDPDFNGATGNPKKDNARISFIFGMKTFGS